MTPEQITALREAFECGWTDGVSSVDRYGDVDDTAEEASARWLLTPAASALASPAPHGDAGLREVREAVQAALDENVTMGKRLDVSMRLRHVLALLDAPPTAAQAEPDEPCGHCIAWHAGSCYHVAPPGSELRTHCVYCGIAQLNALTAAQARPTREQTCHVLSADGQERPCVGYCERCGSEIAPAAAEGKQP